MQKQMAQVVGVPKREPCQNCGNPVFLAERLIIGKSLYHRTCLRCARCDSQLTLGSFYETEIDGEFCCETCPDEEKKIQLSQRLSGEQVADNLDSMSSSRQSFNEKLAVFQKNGKGFLQKSVSDEEKSKSLKRLNELYSKNTPENAESTETQPVESGSENDSDSESSDSEEIDNNKPPVPTTKPPSLSSDESDTEIRPPLPSTKPPPIASKLNVLQKIKAGNSKFNNNNKFVANANTASNNGIAITAKPSHATSTIESHQQCSDAMPTIQSQLSHTNSSINDTSFSNVKNLDDKISFNRNDESSASTAPTNDVNVFAQSPSSIKKENNGNINLDNNKNNDNTMPSDALNSFTNVTKEVKNYDANNGERENQENGVRVEKERTIIEEVVEEEEDGKKEKEEEEEEEEEEEVEEGEVNLRLHTSISNSNECNIINRDSNDSNIDIDSANVDKRQANNSNSNNINRSSNMVRSRLSQFEALFQADQQQQHTETDSINLRSNKSFNHSKLNVDNNRSKSIENSHQPEESQENHSSIDTVNLNELTITAENDNKVPKDDQLLINSNNITNNNDNNTNIDQSEIERELSYHTDEMESDAKQTLTSMKPVPVKRVTKDYSHSEDNALLTPPTPLKRRSKVTAAASASTDQLDADKNRRNVLNEEVTSKKVVDAADAQKPVSQNENEKQEKIKYPENLNPFGDDEDDEEEMETPTIRQRSSNASKQSKTQDNTNPFDSSDDEIELLKNTSPAKKRNQSKLTKPRVSTNPFGSESEDEDEAEHNTSLRTPVPTPRKVINGSMHLTPEPSPRMSRTLQPKTNLTTKNMNELYGSTASLISSNYGLMKNNIHGSMNSLASSSMSTPRHRKGKAPLPPSMNSLSPSTADLTQMRHSRNSSPSNSISSQATPIGKKKRAPAPPTPKLNGNETVTSHYVTANTRLDDSLPSYDSNLDSLVTTTATDSSLNPDTSIDSCTASVQNESLKDSGHDTEVYRYSSEMVSEMSESSLSDGKKQQKKLIPLDACLLNDMKQNGSSDVSANTDENVTYRRTIVPLSINDDLDKSNNGSDRQWEKMKENKESQNKNRQSQVLFTPHDANSVYGSNKSSHGKWKRRKGPAPSLPVPPRKVIQMLPLQEIRHELEVIEVQQQGLEKQGVILEKMIRERCEGTENENTPVNEFKPNSKEVEDLILQLFELVNEKNELFRRQAELMYLRRQHRLEQEQADIEYEIRVLMAQPECNKTDSDKAREEALISRLVEVIELRNKVIESLEMDRLREAEEDQSIKQSLEQHTAKRDEELCQQTPTKLSKKEKKKQKEAKKLAKQKKMDADKDADESELSQEKIKEKKKKKKFLF